ncbi:MAG: acyl-CoA dehydrogenase [Gammaproteobacteria bacterium]|nr:acyl-CoA dehydrogenase [Gammaproteobacteria bacterium]MBT6586591.1 acyl-CoA dehydrogenase [Gammaproteobacteria bacterium]MBT7879390.1 acyl-CoA dehydrogenase [Gammaproteobacteria bacterium]
MDSQFSTADEAFRGEVRSFLNENLSEELREAGRKKTSIWQENNSAMAWQKLLFDKGWAAPEWPAEYGGTDWSLTQRYIFSQECARAETPGISPMGLKMCGPMLIGYGTEEQKNYYLPRILSGEHIWCQGYSEPGAGSDLASLKTFAGSDGDDYIVNGTKIWTSFAQHSNMMFALVRTSTEGKVQQGISFLLIDMATPGIKIEPIINLEGSHELNQVFFDDVRVPKANRVGKENDGWSVAKYLLEFERFSISSIELRRLINRTRRLANETVTTGNSLSSDPAFLKKLAQLEINALAMETSEQRVLANLSAGNRPGSVSSVLNAISAETLQKADELAIEVAAYYGLPYQPVALEVGGPSPIGSAITLPLMPSYMNNRMRTIAGGSAEVQRNIVAKAILEL